MEDLFKKASCSAEYIRAKIKKEPQIGIVLGSGLGTLADEIEDADEIDYESIPNFPLTTVEGHDGRLVYGWLSGKRILAMKGRFHYYEGYAIDQVVFPIRVFKLLGIDNLLVTNAAGSINKNFTSGDLMLIRDHISFFTPSPLRGENPDGFGVRFPDMSRAYDRDLIEMAKRVASGIGINLQEGVYVFAQGPMYETPAEIKALCVLGADAIGMSTVPEVITARHSGMKVLGISCIANIAVGMLDRPLTHEEVIKTAREVECRFAALVKGILLEWKIV